MNTDRPLLGILGGMGTQATASFFEILHKLQNVQCEQDYIDVLLYSKPSTPDRTAYITGQSKENPLDSLICAAKTLESAGVSNIAIPCATAHFFYNELSSAVNVPIINMIDETARYITNCGYKNVYLLATDASLKNNVFHASFEKHGICIANEVHTSDNSSSITGAQSDLMSLIYDIKRGVAIEQEACDMLDNLQKQALSDGADAVVLGCTELCVNAKETPNVINTLEVLAKAALNNTDEGVTKYKKCIKILR